MINAIEVKEVDIGLLFNAGPVNVEYIPWSAKFNAGSVLNYTYKFEIPSFYNSVMAIINEGKIHLRDVLPRS